MFERVTALVDELHRLETDLADPAPVSYTHLDVYKRQVKPRVPHPFFSHLNPTWHNLSEVGGVFIAVHLLGEST